MPDVEVTDNAEQNLRSLMRAASGLADALSAEGAEDTNARRVMSAMPDGAWLAHGWRTRWVVARAPGVGVELVREHGSWTVRERADVEAPLARVADRLPAGRLRSEADGIARIEEMEAMLSEASDHASSARLARAADWLFLATRKARVSAALQDRASRLRAEAERNAGLTMLQNPLWGGRRAEGRATVTYGQLGISEREGARYQALAHIPDWLWAELVRDPARPVPSLSALATEGRRWKIGRGHRTVPPPRLRAVPRKFATIVADPPWSYVQTGAGHGTGGAYDTKRLSSIAALDIPAHPDGCWLWLWATVPLLPQAMAVLHKWGFEYRQTLVWVKNNAVVSSRLLHGRAELVLLGTRGRMSLRDSATNVVDAAALDAAVLSTTGISSSSAVHSRKPAAFYDLVERVCPGPYLELYGRRPRDRWTVWGNDPDVNPFELTLVWDENVRRPGADESVAGPAAKSGKTTKELILEALEGAEAGADAQMLAERTGANPNTIRRALSELAKDGRVERVEPGWFRLAKRRAA